MNGDRLIGRRLANYQVESFLGQGGMAQVYYGHDVSLQRPVAIKVIDARYRGDPGYAKRFVSEARVVATWRHENIIQVYYADKEDDFYYFAMEYIDGMGVDVLLAKYAADYELMPTGDVLFIGRAIASALDYAHKKGVIHRDVKPSNVLISHDDRVVLADFGLALDLQQGTLGETFGTPHYIAPEQARRSSEAVPQSDLYSLGVILYEALTGVIPFDDPSMTSVIMQHMTEPPPSPRSINPALNAETEAVLMKALAKEPEDRYQTGAALLDALEDALLKEASAKTAAAEGLPPMPAGVAPSSTRPVSGLSVSERVALHLDETKAPSPVAKAVRVGKGGRPEKQRTAKARRKSTRKTTAPARGKSRFGNRTLLFVAGFVAIAAIALVLVLGAGGDDDPAATEPLPTRISGLETSTPPPTNTEKPSPEFVAASTNTDMPQPPSATQEPPTRTTAPTFTALPPSATPVPPTAAPVLITVTPVPVTEQVVQPTVLYPNGRPVQLHYDDYSFYMWNGGTDSFRVSQIVFEALTDSGIPIGYRFEGSRWSAFYHLVESGKCDAIETDNAPHLLRPAQCGNRNAVVTPMLSDSMVFWIPRDGVHQFRVLWDGLEVARCEMGAGFCAVWVP